MKKLYLVILLLILSGISVPVYAETATGSSTANETDKLKAIEDLKDRLATKVAELRNLQQKAIAGKVKSQTVSSLTIETKTKDIKIELPDNIKVIQYLKNIRTKLTTDDIDNGDFVVVFGDYDATIDILKAKVILIDNTAPTDRIGGVITDIDDKEFTITVRTTDNIEYLVDVEKASKVSQWADNSLSKSGFSKLADGDTVQIIGTAEPKKDKQISALRILNLGQILPYVQPTPTPTEEPTATPSPKSSAKTGSPTPKSVTPTP